jgi:hypothetical protein
MILKKSRYTDERIAFRMRQAGTCTPVQEATGKNNRWGREYYQNPTAQCFGIPATSPGSDLNWDYQVRNGGVTGFRSHIDRFRYRSAVK